MEAQAIIAMIISLRFEFNFRVLLAFTSRTFIGVKFPFEEFRFSLPAIEFLLLFISEFSLIAGNSDALIDDKIEARGLTSLPMAEVLFEIWSSSREVRLLELLNIDCLFELS